METGEQSLLAKAQDFIKVDDYTTFFCEYTTKGDYDVHFHFFNTKESKSFPRDYWENTFPLHLDKVARAHFGFEYPRLQASIVRGVLPADAIETENEPSDSWWMIAQQLKVPDPDFYIRAFLVKLDQSIESSMRT